MPLIKSASKKAFQKNVKTEMEANPGKENRAQNLAISYDVQRHAKKKKMAYGGKMADKDCYAKGGEVLSAKYESRPMPESEYNDEEMDKRNNGNKALKDSYWTDSPTVAQARKYSLTPLSQPRMAGSDVFSVRNRDLHADEADMGNRMPPESDKAQPPSRDDEEGADRQGPKVSDSERQHSNGKSAYAKGGPVMQPKDHAEQLMERDDEADLEDSASPANPSEQPKSSYDESHDYGMKPGEPDEASPHTGESEADMLRRHADELTAFYEGGRVDTADMNEDEEGADRPDSIADAIMRKKQPSDAGNLDLDASRQEPPAPSFKRYADGGEVDLEKNSEESPNEEDQMSFKANGKEQYDLSQLDAQPEDSNEKGDDREAASENKHDMIDQIRSKMKAKKKL